MILMKLHCAYIYFLTMKEEVHVQLWEKKFAST